MKMKANNNNNITDYYLALFSSINCATATANRNKKSRSIEVNNNNISLNSSKCLIHAPNASLRLISKCVSAECALSIPIGTIQFSCAVASHTFSALFKHNFKTSE